VGSSLSSWVAWTFAPLIVCYLPTSKIIKSHEFILKISDLIRFNHIATPESLISICFITKLQERKGCTRLPKTVTQLQARTMG
jgi:hypothetical protein